MNHVESLRLFFALWPDDRTRDALMQLQSRIQGQTTSYRNLHLTLAFLGQQPVALLSDLKEILAHLPRQELTIELDRIGYFTRQRIVWAGTHRVPDNLLALQSQLMKSLGTLQPAPEVRGTFKPHVTLARNAEPPEDGDFAPIVWHANHIALVKSVTRPTGSLYEVVASRTLEREVRVANESGNDETGQMWEGR